MNEVEKARSFVEREFRAHPHHSFSDWKVMNFHSLMVEDLAANLAEGDQINEIALRISALLHDIGKTYEASEEELHAKHEEYNWAVSGPFLQSLGLERHTLDLVHDLLTEQSHSHEAVIISDADKLAFFKDRHLHNLFLRWAQDRNLETSIAKKAGNFDRLQLAKSKKVGKPWYEQMMRDWSGQQEPTGT
jgi:putative nucleotidyltransferase with HDIG domain